MEEIVYKIKDAKFFKKDVYGKIICWLDITIEGESKNILDSFNHFELENYDITSKDQVDKIRKMLKDYCYKDEEIDDVIYLLENEVK